MLTNWLHALIQKERNNLGRLKWELFGSNFNPVLVLEMFLLQASLGRAFSVLKPLGGEYPPASKCPGDVRCQCRSLALSQDVAAPKHVQGALWGWLSLLMPCELPCGSWSFPGIAALTSLWHCGKRSVCVCFGVGSSLKSFPSGGGKLLKYSPHISCLCPLC